MICAGTSGVEHICAVHVLQCEPLRKGFCAVEIICAYRERIDPHSASGVECFAQRAVSLCTVFAQVLIQARAGIAHRLADVKRMRNVRIRFADRIYVDARVGWQRNCAPVLIAQQNSHVAFLGGIRNVPTSFFILKEVFFK